MPKDYFAERVAARYDEDDAAMFDPAVVEPVVDFLVGLAQDGAALELGIGTGRIAIPLCQRGIRVHGIDLSEAMVARMRAKPGAERIGVTIGDFATAKVQGSFSVVYLVYNTIGNLVRQDDQIRCFQNAARHLADDGVFVLECRVPTAPGRHGHQYVDPARIAADEVVLDVGQYDPVTQVLDLNHVRISASGIILEPICLRLAYPPEFDLMARLAGLRLRERWGGWNGEPYTATSWRHVSVYERSEDPAHPSF